MKAVTLFKEGTHITDVTVQYKGEIAVGSGGVGGEHYLRIPGQERAKLLSALADASGKSLRSEMSDELSDETTMALFEELFGNTNARPLRRHTEVFESEKRGVQRRVLALKIDPLSSSSGGVERPARGPPSRGGVRRLIRSRLVPDFRFG